MQARKECFEIDDHTYFIIIKSHTTPPTDPKEVQGLTTFGSVSYTTIMQSRNKFSWKWWAPTIALLVAIAWQVSPLKYGLTYPGVSDVAKRPMSGNTSFSLDLLKIPIHVLTARTDAEKFRARRDHIASSLESTGFQDFRFAYGIYRPEDPIYACAYGHAMLIEKALQRRPFIPFLILEDDAVHLGLDTTISIPNDADALYVSVSRYGAELWGTEYRRGSSPVYFSNTTIPNIARVYNMLSTHAVVVLSERFASNLLRCAVEASTRSCHLDLLVALTQKSYNVFAQHEPLFFQGEHLGGNEAATRRNLGGTHVQNQSYIPSYLTRPRSVSSDMAEDLTGHEAPI
ncbi:uncharacterized protein N7511_005845 [Penicillium nucicola]|uniref:uncharacterized protein n=1 Tax=Penicillium nucicola TaxID=1850975 RepID=UPI002545461E|nr:uncharacterized protein N7511_005845 [Penicillium nucicola]KAJ5762463.1 hypothetical protein N7511_005845 [Penicillium nucicola]